MESVLCLVKKLLNEIVDLKKNSREGISNQITYKPYCKNPITSSNPLDPNFNLNLKDVVMDNYCNYHYATHSKKSFPQWFRSMTLAENQFFDQQK
jgi:hypothetical protein